MSLSINIDRVTAVFALGEWHPVKKGTFCIDAYEVVDVLSERHQTFYQMGEMYPEVPRTPALPSDPNKTGYHEFFKSPQGCDGCAWVCPKTDMLVAMSILEIKAWRYDTE